MSLAMLWNSSEGVLEIVVTQNWQTLWVRQFGLNMVITITTVLIATRFLNLGLMIPLLLVSVSLKFQTNFEMHTPYCSFSEESPFTLSLNLL